jgi:NADPH-dependent 2,4-dienoyl-CoA reductase/sulfur reductase-like enzyme
MTRTRYLIVGSGMTADAAVSGIRELDSSGSIRLIGDDPHPAYNRPPLTKGLWKGDPESGIWRSASTQGVELLSGRRAAALDVQKRVVTDDQGETHEYDKLLLATGCAPRQLPGAPEGVIYYRTLDDYRHLRAAIAPGRRFVVIGGGFIGSELAAALAMNGQSVALVFPEAGIGARVFPSDLSVSLNDFYRGKGVTVHPGARVEKITRTGTVFSVDLGGQTLTADVVVAGIGVIPNTQLAQAAGLTTNDGIVVDAHLQTSAADVFAAGDVARFPCVALQRPRRVEHEDAANTQGKQAGRAMAGDKSEYTHLPFFYSDLFDLGYEAVGEVDSRLQVFADWKTPFKEGVLYYRHEGRVEGVLLVNTWGQVDKARELIASRKVFPDAELRGRISA